MNNTPAITHVFSIDDIAEIHSLSGGQLKSCIAGMSLKNQQSWKKEK